MPRADSVEIFTASPPNAFVSPFTDRPPVAFYSSIVIPGTDKGDCLPCAITALSRLQLQSFVTELGGAMQRLPLPSLTLNANTPVIPDPPSNAVDTIEVDMLIGLGSPTLLRPATFARVDAEAIIGTALKPFWVHNGGGTVGGFTATTTDGSNIAIFWGDTAAPTTAASGAAKSHTYA